MMLAIEANHKASLGITIPAKKINRAESKTTLIVMAHNFISLEC
jgi:hypothetical protein